MKKSILGLLLTFSVNLLAQQTQVTYDYYEYELPICTATLMIDTNESIFKLNDTRSSGLDEKNSTDDKWHYVQNDPMSKIIYSTDKFSVVRLPLYGKELVYKIELDSNGSFEFTGRTKKIGNFNCEQVIHKAYGKELDIWFTTEVPLSFGPIKLNDFPGLIVEVIDLTINRKYILNKIENTIDKNLFISLKNFIKSKTPLSKLEYDAKTTEILQNRKRSVIAKMNEIGATISFTPDEKASTEFLIDIPDGLIPALNKITQ